MPNPLPKKFENLLERMQTEAARKGMLEAFNASPEALGQAAVQAVQRRVSSS
jgi:hypothetical protein